MLGLVLGLGLVVMQLIQTKQFELCQQYLSLDILENIVFYLDV